MVLYTSVPRSWKLAAPTTDPCGISHKQTRRVDVSPLPHFDFTLPAIEPRSRIKFYVQYLTPFTCQLQYIHGQSVACFGSGGGGGGGGGGHRAGQRQFVYKILCILRVFSKYFIIMTFVNFASFRKKLLCDYVW